MYIKRRLESEVLRATNLYPVVAVLGIRQCGKSTMLNHILPSGFHTASVDDVFQANLAESDPFGYIMNHGLPLFIDEAQNAPSLFGAMFRIIEERKKAGQPVNGLFWISGSNKTKLDEQIKESLAGRVAIYEMSTLSKEEIEGRSEEVFDPLYADIPLRNGPSILSKDLYSLIFSGGFPGQFDEPRKTRDDLYGNFVASYIDKDVKSLIAAKSVPAFSRLLEYCSAYIAQQFNCEKAATAVGVDVKTIKKWLAVLENCGLIYFLKPYNNSMSKRLVKIPKLYFMDTGLAVYLGRWFTSEQLEVGAMSGAYLENYVISEVVKSHYNNHKRLDCLFYYRDFDQAESDLVFANNERAFPLEIKKSSSPRIPSKDVMAKFKLFEKSRYVLCGIEKKFVASNGGWTLIPFSSL